MAWISWSNIRSKLAYDLHKIRGPPAWPLLGNLDEILGSSYLYKVLNHMSGGGIETSARIHIAAVGPNSQSTCACVSFNLVANINPASKAYHLNYHKRLCPCAAVRPAAADHDPRFCNLKPRFAISGSVLSANVTLLTSVAGLSWWDRLCLHSRHWQVGMSNMGRFTVGAWPPMMLSW